MKSLEHLLQPIEVRGVEIANRVVMPPMGTALAEKDGTVSDANVAYLRRRARGGAGLIITEICAVHPQGLAGPHCLGGWDDSFIPGLKRLAGAVHAEGGKIALQLHHAGRESLYQIKKGNSLGPSAIPSHVYGIFGSPRAFTPEEIHETIAAFGQGARRARAAGFDAVELHGAHGYLLCQFLSACSNQREDEYGGDFRQRARFVVECLQAARAAVGDDFPISLRLSVEELVKGGYTADDIQGVAPDFTAAGADILHASFGTHGNPRLHVDTPNASAPIEFAPGFKAYLARALKEVVDVPVIAVGRFTDPFMMDATIARGDADLVAVGRQHLADPDFLRNAIAGRPAETTECLACNQGCIERLIFEGQSVRCAINPETGQELDYPTGRAANPQQVWIVGGGPAGLTAASEAARLGHRVELFEADASTGGQVRYAARAPHKEAYVRWIDALAQRCRDRGVTIHTGRRVSEDMLQEGRFDAVILATGGSRMPCPVECPPGTCVCDAWQILDGAVAPQDHVVIIGAGLVGMETADFLCARGVSDITVVEQLASPPVIPFTAHGYMLNQRLAAHGVQQCYDTAVTAIAPDSVSVTSRDEPCTITPVAQVIVAVGLTSRNELKDYLVRNDIRHFVVGDCLSPRRIIEATTEGARAAWNI